jgi:hypothetical protein
MSTIEISGTLEQLEVRVSGNLDSAADVAPLAGVLAAADADQVVVDLSSTMYVAPDAALALRAAFREAAGRLALSVVVPSIDVRVELVRADVDHVVALLLDRSQVPGGALPLAG